MPHARCRPPADRRVSARWAASWNFRFHFVRDALQRLPVENAFVDQATRETNHRVALGFRLPLRGGLVEPLVVGKRMRIGTGHVGVHQRRSASRAAIFGRLRMAR